MRLMGSVGRRVRALALAARVVAPSGLLDLDHARAHVGQQHRAIRAREHACQINNGEAGERAGLGLRVIVEE